MSPRYENKRELFREIHRRRPQTTREQFEVVCPWDDLSFDDYDLREVLQALSRATPDDDVAHDAARSMPDPVAVRSELELAGDEHLASLVATVRREVFGSNTPPFPNDEGSACRWIVGELEIVAAPEEELRRLLESVPAGIEDEPTQILRLQHVRVEDKMVFGRVVDGSALDRILEVARILDTKLNVTDSVFHILTGQSPSLALEVTIEQTMSRLRNKTSGAITIKVRSKYVSPEEVAAVYEDARAKLWKVRRRQQFTSRDKALLHFLQSESETDSGWETLRVRWNRTTKNPEWRFDSSDQFRMACERAKAKAFS